MNESLEGALKLIDEQLKYNHIHVVGQAFSTYALVYAFPTENINGYLSLLPSSPSSPALSVLASGDQLFSLASLNYQTVDTFDSNNLTSYYVFGLKLATLLKYNYEEYLRFYREIFNINDLEQLSATLSSLLPYMPSKYRQFWQKLISENYKRQKNNPSSLNLLQMLFINQEISPLRSTYLLNEENYNKARSQILKMNITFHTLDILELPSEFSRKYHLILLSNIADYLYMHWNSNWSYQNLQAFSSEFKTILNEQGLLALAYLTRKYSLKSQSYANYLISNSGVTLQSLTNEELIHFPSISHQSIVPNVEDALLLVRK